MPLAGAVGLEGADRDIGGVRLGGRPVDLEGRQVIREGSYP
jgi:hypothetical protein